MDYYGITMELLSARVNLRPMGRSIASAASSTDLVTMDSPVSWMSWVTGRTGDWRSMTFIADQGEHGHGISWGNQH